MTDDDLFIARTLELAERGWGRVHPNPLVGAVVVRDGRVIGEGHHAEFGGPHAEVVALDAAGDSARGATLYVALEPCAHHGKTPPCTDAILAAGIARVVYGAADPHPQAKGGATVLRKAGVDVRGGIAEERVREQNAAFFHTVETGRAFIALKYALSLDARLSLRSGAATEVTGAEARAEAHRLRAGFEAIMVGSGTLRADDPLLTVRGPVSPRVPPLRVAIDTEARLPPRSRLVQTAAESPVLVACAEDAPAERLREIESAGARTLRLPRAPGGVDLGALIAALEADGVRSILCEGGGLLGSALLRGGHVQRLYLFYAPVLFGEGGAAAFPGDLGAMKPGAWRRTAVKELGRDILLVLDRTQAPPLSGPSANG